MLAISTILFVTLSTCVAHDNEEIGLGEAIYVPSKDLLGSVPSGVRIFNTFSKGCIREMPLDVISKHDDYYSDTASFYSSIATATNLRGSYKADFSMGATLDVTTKSVSSSERKVSGDSVKMVSKAHKKVVKKGCLYRTELTESFVSDFQNLGNTISKPRLFESWRKYWIFLKKWGSHLVTEVVYGSSIDQYSFAKSDKKYTERDFTVKSCISLAGDVGIKKLNVSLCAGVTSEETSKVSRLEIVNSLTVRGGTAATRAKLLNKRTHDLIENFMTEGSTNPAVIQFKLKPIWEILQETFSSTDDLAKAINLEYYYQGFLNFGCPSREKNGQALQRFELTPYSKPSRPEYQCSLAPEGCQKDSDCHYRVGVTCACHGNSCIRYNTKTLNTDKTRKTADPYHGGSWNWQGCDWKVWGSRCGCRRPRTERKVIWSLNSNRADMDLDYLAGGKLKVKKPKKLDEERRKKEKITTNRIYE